jgi:hypothetical protein
MMRREWSPGGTDWKFRPETAVSPAPSPKRLQAHKKFAEIATRFSGESTRISEKKKAAKVSRHVIGFGCIQGKFAEEKSFWRRKSREAIFLVPHCSRPPYCSSNRSRHPDFQIRRSCFR